MKISFAITVCNELEEIKRLVPFILKHKRIEDEIVILVDISKEDNGELRGWLNETSQSLILKDNPLKIHEDKFQGHFANWKNNLNEYCTGNYIFQLDADEMISEYMVKNVSEIVSLNLEVELLFLPRINTVDGITEEHIKTWNWKLDDLGRINYPDYQGRLYKKGLRWEGKVHERIVGVKHYSLLPSNEETYCIIHHKNIIKQEKQNNLYKNI